MSLMKTLAKVAAGVMVAKGMGAVMRNQQGGQSGRRTSGGFLDNLLQNNSNRGSGSSSGGLGGIFDKLTNQNGRSGSSGGGLSDILGQFGGGGSRNASSGGGGLGDLLGGLLGGGAAGAAVGGLAQKGSQPKNDASFGEVFNDALITNDEPEVAPTPEQNAVAGLMLRAMIQAAKSDGKIDDAEKQRLMGEIGEIDEDEKRFIREEMAAPVDAEGLAREVPKGMEAQVYMMSLMAIDLDSKAEAEYLHKLAQAMGLEKNDVNQIHDQVGVQNLYS